MNDASQYTDMNLALAASEAAEDVVRDINLSSSQLSLSEKKKRNRTTIPTDENARGLCFRTCSIPSNGYNRKSCETKGTILSPQKITHSFIQCPTRVSSPESTSISKEEEKERHYLLFDSYVRWFESWDGSSVTSRKHTKNEEIEHRPSSHSKSR